MADENKPQGEETPEEQQPGEETTEESGLGNLPPLSDFESQASDGDELPPLRDFDTGETPDAAGGGEDEESYPGISDIEVETPQPTGGNIRPAPPGFESSAGQGDRFSSGASPLDTPHQESGFQDLAADSDFSPETPDIGPGPGSDQGIDTPMFDSAFGGGEDFQSGMGTPAPTQAMETPMFGGSEAGDQGGGFEPGAFSGGAGGGMDFEPGTPPPDFSPDTDIQAAQAAAPAGRAKRRGGGVSVSKVLVALVVGILAGVGVYPFIRDYVPLPDPQAARIEELKNEIRDLETQKARLERIQADQSGKVEVTQERLDELKAELDGVRQEVEAKQKNFQETDARLKDQTAALQAAEDDLARINEEYSAAQAVYTDLENETAIIQARHRGLMAEVERLTGNVGELDEAAERRAAVKRALLANVNALLAQVEKSLPLTPPKYAYGARLERARQLRNSIEEADWVKPERQNAYTDLQLQELELTQATEYFFAKIPFVDEVGQTADKWAECLMQGNRRVLIRSLDGKNAAIYTNLATAGAPQWGFVYDIPKEEQKRIEREILDARTPDFQEQIMALVDDQVRKQAGTELPIGGIGTM